MRKINQVRPLPGRPPRRPIRPRTRLRHPM